MEKSQMLFQIELGGEICMQEFEMISIRGRMAYILCSFEKLLLYYGCEKEDWSWILDKLWDFTSVKEIDEWCYLVGEMLPNTVMNDDSEGLEYISVNEFNRLRKIYVNNNDDINRMLYIIFELGTAEIYSRVCGYSNDTLLKVKEGVELLKKRKIELVSVNKFEKYRFNQKNGWGECFDGKELSIFLV